MAEGRKTYVLDTSVAAKLFYIEEHSDRVRQLVLDAAQGQAELIAPQLLLFELNNVFVAKGSPKEERDRFRRKLLELIAEGFIHVRSTTEANLMASADMAATETHGQAHIRTFDAVFHALAIDEQAILLTADAKHYNKTAATFGSVALIGDLEL